MASIYSYPKPLDPSHSRRTPSLGFPCQCTFLEGFFGRWMIVRPSKSISFRTLCDLVCPICIQVSPKGFQYTCTMAPANTSMQPLNDSNNLPGLLLSPLSSILLKNAWCTPESYLV